MPKKEEFVVFTYDLSKLNNVTKVKFVYVLKGRAPGEGIIDEFKGFFLVPGCFVVPSEKDKEIEAIFKSWKIPYKREGVLIR